ncbi:MAG: sulfite exporter TauE/SafE family protein [Terriglobia bacterium]
MDLTWLAFVELVGLGMIAGAAGSLTGIGGGMIITPVLTLGFGVPIHQAIATSLCCVIATSSGAAASYIEQRLSDIRLGMTLELATTVGAISGSLVAALLSRESLAVGFALLLVYAGASMVRRSLAADGAHADSGAPYQVKRLPLGLCGSGAAGIISGMLGVGGGVVKVPVMYLVMGVPFKVATATSNFMIGVTAAASAFIYFARGDVRPLVTAPTAVGVFLGAALGSRLLRRTPGRWLILLFSIIAFYFAAIMMWKALHGGFAR